MTRLEKEIKIFKNKQEEVWNFLNTITKPEILRTDENQKILEDFTEELTLLNQNIEKIISENKVEDLIEQQDFYSSLLKTCKQLRKENNYSIVEVAKFLKISPTTYQNFEKGRGNINLVLFFKIMDFFKIKLFFDK